MLLGASGVQCERGVVLPLRYHCMLHASQGGSATLASSSEMIQDLLWHFGPFLPEEKTSEEHWRLGKMIPAFISTPPLQ